jgi:hypothetical protein
LAEHVQLDKAKIDEAFRLMGQYLLDRKAFGEIAVYGGSAIILQFEWRLRSEDVDARVISAGNHGVVIDAARVTAARPEYMLAMKLSALERVTADDRDFKDAIRLGIECAVTTVQGLRDIFKFANEELSLDANLRLRELADAIQRAAAARK